MSSIIKTFFIASSIFLALNIALLMYLLGNTNETDKLENQCNNDTNNLNDIKKGYNCYVWNKEKKICLRGYYDSNLVCKEIDMRMPYRQKVMLIISIIFFLLSLSFYIYKKWNEQ